MQIDYRHLLRTLVSPGDEADGIYWADSDAIAAGDALVAVDARHRHKLVLDQSVQWSRHTRKP